MYRNLKIRLGLWLCILSISALAVGGALYLGKLYLGIIREGGVPKSTKVDANTSKSVVARDEQKTLLLNPIPVYYLQVGVYSDLQGAQEAAVPFQEMGYMPYITQSAPYKIWIGIYQRRGDTEFVKQQLRDKGFGSFTAATVINGSNLRYNKGMEAFMMEIAPVLEVYTVWLKENLALFQADHVDRLNWDIVEKQYPVIEKVYSDIRGLNNEASSNNDAINEKFRSLNDTVGGYQTGLEVLKKQRNQESYSALQYRLLEFIDNYLLLWQRIDNISKT